MKMNECNKITLPTYCIPIINMRTCRHNTFVVCILRITHFATVHPKIYCAFIFSVRVRVWELFFLLNVLKETVMVFCVRQLFQVNLH